MSTLDSGVIVFDKLASHEANGESGLSNTSGLGAEISDKARERNIKRDGPPRTTALNSRILGYKTKERRID